jgi:hypothetical protein
MGRASKIEPATIKHAKFDRQTCEVCDEELPHRAVGAGRPRHYHPGCKRVRDALSALERALYTIHLEGEAARRLRAELWSIGNDLEVTSRKAEVKPPPRRGGAPEGRGRGGAGLAVGSEAASRNPKHGACN